MLATVKRQSTEHALALMDIAPCPGGGRQRAHDRMVRRMEVFGCVLARRRVATADVTAGLAFAQRDPKRSLRQTLGTAVGSRLLGKIRRGQTRQMFTRLSHLPSYCKANR